VCHEQPRWRQRLRRAPLTGQRVCVCGRAPSVTIKAANAEGASWKAMYLDGFSGDTLTQLAAMSRALLGEEDPVRRIISRAEEKQRRKQAGEPTTDEVRDVRLYACECVCVLGLSQICVFTFQRLECLYSYKICISIFWRLECLQLSTPRKFTALLTSTPCHQHLP
jgi:hypothetical protein